MALDGSCMEVADESANAAFFGYPAASRGQSAFPQARLLGLVECGTHVVVAAEVAPYACSEQAMAAQMLPVALKPDMLVLADRNFFSFKLWQTACAAGAKLLLRPCEVLSSVSNSAVLEVANNSLGAFLQHRHMFVSSFA